MSEKPTTKLELQHVSKEFGGVRAVNDVSFEIEGAQLVGLIGPNGAGKTTLTNMMSGALSPSVGTIHLNGKRIDGLRPSTIARNGLGRTFQVTRALRRMTVLENMMVPALAMHPEKSREELHEKALEMLHFLTIEHLTNEYGRALSGGQQKLLELARLTMLDPSLIILDEPFAGVHPRLQEKIYGFIHRMHDEGKSILLISHDMSAVFELSERLLVLNFGELIADGTPDEVREMPEVIEAYLGEDEEIDDVDINELSL
jgi:branched-chain amino acid transport system ATP-binding protein